MGPFSYHLWSTIRDLILLQMSLHSESTSTNGFESISLGSTIVHPTTSPLKYRTESSRPVFPNSIPESTSEDDEPDLQEFLFPDSPEMNDRKSPTPTLDRNSTPNLLHSAFFQNPSIMLESEVLSGNGSIFNSKIEPNHDFSIAFKQRDQDSPLEYLQSKNSTHYKEIRKNIRNHRILLEQGSDKINKVRSMISQNFEHLSENFYSLNEIYSRDTTTTEALLRSFESWDKKRDKILNRIKVIKSMDNKHGHKLGQLLEQSADVDGEINDLEKRLESAKEKKRLLLLEIDKTSSVLESRTSKYVESFKRLEKQGQDAVAHFFRLNGMPDKDLNSVIKQEPVNVKFSRNHPPSEQHTNLKIPKNNSQYEQPMNMRVLRSDREIANPVESSPRVVESPFKAESMGMQPLIVPEDTPAHDESSLNHDKGPSAFEKGFARGSKRSVDVKSKLIQFLKLVKESGNDSFQQREMAEIPKVDDIDNTIESKIDVEPILLLLMHKIEALEDLVLWTSRQATQFHEFSLRWKDLIAYIKNEEIKLSSQIANSIESQSEMQSELVHVLASMLQNLKGLATLEPIKSPQSSEPDRLLLQTAVGNEVRNVYLALKVISEPSQYQLLADDFKNLGYNDID